MDELEIIRRERIRRELNIYRLREQLTEWAMAERVAEGDALSVYRPLQRFLGGGRPQAATVEKALGFLLTEAKRDKTVASHYNRVTEEIFSPSASEIECAKQYMAVLGSRHISLSLLEAYAGYYEVQHKDYTIEVLVELTPSSKVLIARARLFSLYSIFGRASSIMFSGFVVPSRDSMRLHLTSEKALYNLVVHIDSPEIMFEANDPIFRTMPYRQPSARVLAPKEPGANFLTSWGTKRRWFSEMGESNASLAERAPRDIYSVEFHVIRKNPSDKQFRDMFVTGHNMKDLDIAFQSDPDEIRKYMMQPVRRVDRLLMFLDMPEEIGVDW